LLIHALQHPRHAAPREQHKNRSRVRSQRHATVAGATMEG
jgi:hypothetical protein